MEKEYKDWLNTKVLQKVAFFDEAGNVLVLKRIDTGPASRLGKMDLPGGSLGESDVVMGTKPHEVAIKREAFEETGLTITDLKIVFMDSWVFSRSVGNVLGLAIGYQAKVIGVKPEVKLSDEHSEYFWLSKEEALNSDFGDDGSLHKSIIEKAD